MTTPRTLAAFAVASSVLLARPAAAATFGVTPATIVVAPAVARRDVVDLGRAPASTPIRVAVTLAYRNEAQLEGLVQLQGTPTSPLFHHFITPAQFANYFAPSPADYERVVASLQSAGFHVAPGLPNRTVIDAVANAPIAERYFGTEFHRVTQRNVGVRYANLTPAKIPASIAGAVSTVLGLDNLVKFKSMRVPAQRGMRTEIEPAQSPLLSGPIERTSGGSFEGLLPTGISIAYKYPSQNNITGTGHGIAVVMDSDIANGDLVTYWKAAGIRRTGTFSRVLVNGKNPGINGDVGETAIDTEMTTSLAPGANVYLYLVENLDDAPIEDAYNLAITNGKIDVTSSSFGGCELDDTPFSKATNALAVQGGSEGMTFTASSGDAGGDCEDQNAQGGIYYEADIVNSPAANSAFLAIGGTTLTINATTGARVSETSWSPGGANGGGGGGVSSYFPKPRYQTGVTGIAVVPTIKVTPPASQPKSGFAGRNIPDISLDASNGGSSYVAFYDTPDGGWTGYGGTSVSNPMYAALLTEQNQQNKSLSGVANTALYAAFTSNGTKPAGIYGTEFFDIKSGATGGGWTAKAGFDQSTGIGSVLNGSL
jgi:kumamolisin